MAKSFRPQGLWPARLLHPWASVLDWLPFPSPVDLPDPGLLYCKECNVRGV